ncbi:MAG: hypothetical protein WAT70_05145 [Rhizobiaceae bacterium]
MAALWSETAGRLMSRRDGGRIDTRERVFHFARTRSALLTQKKLYGYLKERIGIRYPEEFARPEFARSMRIATIHIYAASLSDLTVFCVANAMKEAGEADKQHAARDCFRLGIDENAAAEFAAEKLVWIDSFEARVGRTLWPATGEGAWHFTESPKALVKWAPIADELKKLDREIVENSLRFAWIEVRNDFMARLDADAVVRDRPA